MTAGGHISRMIGSVVKKLQMKPQNIYGQFSDKNGFEPFFMLFGTKRGLFELIFEFLKILKTESEAGPQNMQGKFSDENGFKHFFMLFGTKRGFFEFIFDFLKFLKTELALGTPKETTLFSDEK